MNRANMYNRGFSLLELLVAISIIVILSSVAMAGWNAAQEKAQDSQRISELRQLKFAMELYHNEHGYYPRQSEGANGRIGEGAGVDAMLAPHMTAIPVDPFGPGSDTYYYYYDGNATCEVSEGEYISVAVVFAFNMAQQTGNGAEHCLSWGGEGGSGTQNAYHIILGETD